jgi:hypothetical protein
MSWRRVAVVWVALLSGGVLACDDGGGAERSDATAGGDADAGSPVDAHVPGPDATPADATVSDGRVGDAGVPVDAASLDAGEDATPPDAGPPLRVAQALECPLVEDPCAPREAEPGVWASYRKDAYFPDEIYDEYTDAPVDGGRFHIALTAAVGGRVTGVFVEGVDAESIYAPQPGETPAMEWLHVWPETLEAGAPFWVTFHSRDPAWDARDVGRLRVATDAGDAFDGTFPVQRTAAPLTYVTFGEDGRLLVHARNDGDAPVTLRTLRFNGVDRADDVCGPRTIEPGGSALWTVPLCARPAPGAAWTVVAGYDGAAPAVGAGRVLPAFFPIHTWNNTSDCPFPGEDAENLQRHREGGLDTLYMHGGTCSENKCDCDPTEVIGAVGAAPDLNVLISSDFGLSLDLEDTTGLAGLMTGDESDGEIYDDETGVPYAALKARKARASWARYPHLPTFNGGKTNGHIGVFAGKADVQGMDVYIGACAPHITAFGTHPPARMPYDYLRNTRENHMPLPTWLWTQGLSPAWNRDASRTRERLHIQPDPAEILVQALSAVAAGAKGLLWFQTNMEEALYRPDRWDAITAANRLVRSVRSHLLVGDPTGGARADHPEVLVEAIHAPDALVVVVVNLAADEAPTDATCLLSSISEDMQPHWVFTSVSPAIEVRVPARLEVEDAFEVHLDGSVSDLALPWQLGGDRAVTFDDVALDHARPVRLFVLGRAGVRAGVEAAATW